MNPTVLSIDPGSQQLGWALLRGYDLVATDTINASKSAYEDRIPSIIDGLEDIAATPYEFEWVVCERAFVHKFKNTAILQVTVRAVKAWAARGKYQFCLYSPSSWKAGVVGSGAARKERIAEMIPLYFPDKNLRGLSEHQLDAIGIGLHHVNALRIKAMGQKGDWL